MADRSILYRLRAALQGAYVAVAREIQLLATYAGVVSGANSVESALQRLDGTGVGAAIFTFSGPYQAQNSNISEWFGNRQQTRLRCLATGGIIPPTFTLPGATALNTAFDALVAAGLPEVLRFVIEYTGPSTTFLRVIPRAGVGNPVIGGTTAIIVRTGIAATVEITRTSGTLSDYVFQSIGGIGDTGGGTLDALKLIAPSEQVWDASETGILPENGVVKGNAYKVVNAPADASGRFGETMQNGDWVVWEAESFTSWAATPHAWFVLPAHDVRRITALEQDFLTGIQETPQNDRNTIIRGPNYADEAGEIRLKMYATAANYSAADLNTTGDVDEYTEPASINGVLAVRLTGTNASLASTLPDLYAYLDDGNNNFLLLGNMATDFTFQGDFGAESDYLLAGVSYPANAIIRIYRGTVEERYNHPDLDVFETNLSKPVQAKLNQRPDPPGQASDIATLTAKVDTMYQLAPDIRKLLALAAIFDPSQTTQEVHILRGYSSMLDYRGDATRYQQAGITYDNTGTDAVRYTGLTDGFFRLFGFKVTAPAAKTLLSLGSGASAIPLIDMTAAGNYRLNNYHFEVASGAVVTNQAHFLTRSAGVEQLQAGEINVSTFQIPNYPSGSSEQSRRFEIEVDVFSSGADTLAGHFATLEIPDVNEPAERRTVDAAIYLGPLHNNRTVNVTLSYTYRVEGANLFVDIRLVTAPSDVTIKIDSPAVYLNYTAGNTTTRMDNWEALTDAGGNYTFTGENELLVLLAPIVGGDANIMEAVPVARASDGTVTQLNDANAAIPHVGFGSIEIPDDIDFRSALSDHYLRHSELATIITRTNTQWVYGLAELATVTENEFTALLDMNQNIALPSPDGTRWEISVSDAGELNIDSK